MSDHELCPFSKAIMAKWAHCPYAKVYDRPAGKMKCLQASERLRSCHDLDEHLKDSSRFILGIRDPEAPLTHAQLMKIRCGGLIGLSREFAHSGVSVPDLCEELENAYQDIDHFPFGTIVKDIQSFEFRIRKKEKGS